MSFAFKKLTLSLLLASAMALPAQAAETYTLDPAHTAVQWSVDYFGFSRPSGKFMNVDGKLLLDEADPAKSSVEVSIALAGVNSGVPKLDEHLQSPDFFDSAKFPTATFKSDKVEVLGADASSPDGGGTMAKVSGVLTLHGVSKPVVLDVRLNKIGENMFKKKTAGFTATTTIKRSDFGIVTYLPSLGDEVVIAIESEANLAS